MFIPLLQLFLVHGLFSEVDDDKMPNSNCYEMPFKNCHDKHFQLLEIL